MVVVCQAYTPIKEQSWVKFRKVKDPTYDTVPQHGEPDIIHTTHILIEEKISTLSMLVQKSVRDFQSQMKKYAADIKENVLLKPQQIMVLFGNQSYDINMVCYSTITVKSFLD